jgi:hypothetical protein
MKYEANTIEAYLKAIPKDRVEQINQLREVIKKNLPKGFEEVMQYHMISYVIPLKTYPKGYHVTPNTALQLMAIASQKQTINVYNHGIYVDQEMHAWFETTYQKLMGKKPNMGKSCIRFKKIDENALQIIGELSRKITVEDYIKSYEAR